MRLACGQVIFMPLHALLVTRDAEAIQVLNRVLGHSGILSEVCSLIDVADQAVRKRKFEAVFVDCDDLDGGDKLLQRVRKSASNQSTIVFGLIHDRTTMRGAFQLGAKFVLPKPISLERAVRSIRAAHGLIVNERRRFFRYEVEVTATVAYANRPEMRANLTNISEGGMALRFNQPIEPNHSVEVSFTLPEQRLPIHVKGKVVWADPTGRAGVQIQHLPLENRTRLTQWLDERGVGEPTPQPPSFMH